MSVATLLAEHVGFRCSSVDRIGIRGYVPGLRYDGGLVKFLVNRGYPIPAPPGLNHNQERLVAELDKLAASSGVPMVRFGRSDCKEEVARPFQDAALEAGRSGLVLIGKAQERAQSWRGWIDTSHPQHRPGHPHIVWRLS